MDPCLWDLSCAYVNNESGVAQFHLSTGALALPRSDRLR